MVSRMDVSGEVINIESESKSLDGVTLIQAVSDAGYLGRWPQEAALFLVVEMLKSRVERLERQRPAFRKPTPVSRNTVYSNTD